jgi:hypothetical protein
VAIGSDGAPLHHARPFPELRALSGLEIDHSGLSLMLCAAVGGAAAERHSTSAAQLPAPAHHGPVVCAAAWM